MRARLIITLLLALLLASCGDDDGVFPTGSTQGPEETTAITAGASTSEGPTTTTASSTITSLAAPAGLSWARVRDDEAIFGPSAGGAGVSMRSVAAGGPGLVAVGYEDSGEDWDAAVWTSADGLTWSRVPHDEAVFGGPDIQDMEGVVAGGPGLVAVGWDHSGGEADAAVWVSADGFTWTRVSDAALGGPGDQAMRAVAAGGPGLVAVGDEFGPETPELAAAVWTSPDGLAWTRVPHDEAVFGGPGPQSMTAVAAWGQGLVAVGYEDQTESDTNAAVWTSPDGVTWARIPHDDAVFGGAGDQWIGGVAGAGTGVVAVGSVWTDEDGTAVVWWSSDGAIWNRIPDDEAVFGGAGWAGMVSVAAGGPGLVAVGSGGSEELEHAAVWVSPPTG